ncbi:SpoIIE family protein phosphatase [Bacillus sp. AK128]
MEPLLDEAPCGYVSFRDDGIVTMVNATLATLLGYEKHEIIDKHFNNLLPLSGQAFYQMFILPLLKVESSIRELYLSLQAKDGREIPILLNGNRRKRADEFVNECVLIKVENRDKFENEIILAKKEAEVALQDKEKAFKKVEQLLVENVKYQEQMQEELSLAKNIQKLSTMVSMNKKEINIQSYYTASNDLSGDIFGYYPVGENKYGIILLDVMGHGISSALISMSLRSLFQALVSNGSSPLEIVQEMDTYLHLLFQDQHDLQHFSTLLYVEIDVFTKKVTYLNAGHPSGIIQNPDGNQTELSSISPPIGVMQGLTFHQESCSYIEGSRLFLYTDGVSDLIAVNDLKELLKETRNLSIQQVREKLALALEEKTQTTLNVDDQCFLLLDLP